MIQIIENGNKILETTALYDINAQINNGIHLKTILGKRLKKINLLFEIGLVDITNAIIFFNETYNSTSASFPKQIPWSISCGRIVAKDNNNDNIKFIEKL